MSFTPKFLESFELGTDEDWAGFTSDADSEVTTGSKKNGSYGMSVDSADGYAQWPAPDDILWTDEAYMGVWHKLPSASVAAGGPCFWTNDGTPIRIHVELRSDGKYQAFINDVSVATGNIVVTHTDWNHVQVRLKMADSGGILQVKINNVLDIDYVGDTKPSSGAEIGYFGLYSGGNNQENYFDDLAAGLDDWPTKLESAQLTVNSDDLEDWTPSTGTDSYALVDEVPSNDADYVESTTNDDEDSFGTSGGWDDTGKAILAFVTKARVKSFAGTEAIQLGVYSEVPSTYDSSLTPVSSYRIMQGIITEDPNTGSDWATDTAINAAKPAIKSVISGGS